MELRCYAGASGNLHRLLKWYKWSGCGLREHHTPNCFSTLSQLKKPMDVGRCVCITALLQLDDCSPQGCQILAAAQETSISISMLLSAIQERDPVLTPNSVIPVLPSTLSSIPSSIDYLDWNALPPIDLSQSALTIKRKLTVFLFDHFESTFNSDDPCSFHYVCPCNRCSLTPHNPTFT